MSMSEEKEEREGGREEGRAGGLTKRHRPV